MLRVLEDRPGRPFLHDAARVHDDDAIAKARDQSHVVGDQDHGRAQLATEVAQQLDDRCLDGHIERRGGLVGDEQGRLVGHAHRDHRALAHAAGELVRVIAHAVFRCWDADALQHRDHALLRLLVGEPLVGDHRLLDLEPNAKDRVERGHRVLEDHRDLVAAELPDLVIRHLQHVLLSKQDPAADLARLGHEAQQRERRHRLARPGLPDHADDLAPIDVEGDPVDRVDCPTRHGKVDVQVLNSQQRGQARTRS